jgi:hypothetical protein
MIEATTVETIMTQLKPEPAYFSLGRCSAVVGTASVAINSILPNKPRASLHAGLELRAQQSRSDTIGKSRLAIEPDRHAGLETGSNALRVEAQPQRTAVVVADRALRLPGRERTERHQLGDNCLAEGHVRRYAIMGMGRHSRWRENAVLSPPAGKTQLSAYSLKKVVTGCLSCGSSHLPNPQRTPTTG